MEITNLVVACKLSDGSVRTIITNRETEIEILKTIRNTSKDGELTVSEQPVFGIDITIPTGTGNLNDYIRSLA